MKPEFIGRVNWAPQDHKQPDLWQLEEPYGQLTSDGLMVISPPWKQVNGASIPKWAWRLVGHPFEGNNRIWSVNHDVGYHREAIVLDYKRSNWTAEFILESYGVLDLSNLTVLYPGRKWWDKVVMTEGMQLCNETRLKQWAVKTAVLIGGARSWRKSA